MDEIYAAAAAAAGGLTIPFIVGYFVHAGARAGGKRVPWALESRPRLIAESSYYFVALLVAASAGAGPAWKLPLPAAWLIFVIQFVAAAAAFGAYFLAAKLKDVASGKLTFHGKEIPYTFGEFLALALISLPVFCWSYIFRTLMERWDLGRAAEDEPLKMSLPLAILFLTPLALGTFSFTAQTWGVLFAHHRYSYPDVKVHPKTNGRKTVAGGLVEENEHDVRVFDSKSNTVHIVSRDEVAKITVTFT